MRKLAILLLLSLGAVGCSDHSIQYITGPTNPVFGPTNTPTPVPVPTATPTPTPSPNAG
jgi:hypothetical protein